MNANQKAKAIEAIEILLGENPGDKIPNVDKVSDLAGFKLSAIDRDEALLAYHEKPEKKLPDPAPVDVAEDVTSAHENAEVTNNTNSPITVQGVVIPANATVTVPAFNASRGVVKLWVERGVLTVG